MTPYVSDGPFYREGAVGLGRNVTLREHRARGEREQRQRCDQGFHFRSPYFIGARRPELRTDHPPRYTAHQAVTAFVPVGWSSMVMAGRAARQGNPAAQALGARLLEGAHQPFAARLRGQSVTEWNVSGVALFLEVPEVREASGTCCERWPRGEIESRQSLCSGFHFRSSLFERNLMTAHDNRWSRDNEPFANRSIQRN
jgi:hypothetical protein